MLNVLLTGLGVLIAVGIAVLAIKAILRIIEAVPQAGAGVPSSHTLIDLLRAEGSSSSARRSASAARSNAAARESW